MRFKLPLWRHQVDALLIAKDKPNHALFFEQGCGKTAVAINLMRYHCNRNQRLLRTLILCPLIVVKNWVRELQMHSMLPEDRIVPLQGPSKKRLMFFQSRCLAGPAISGKVVITNYEAMHMDQLLLAFHQWQPEMLILDESHKVKSMKAARTKKVIKLREHAKYCYLLSGTPMPNGLEDLFSQYLIMDKGKTFGDNFFAFRAKYFEDKNRGMPKLNYFPNWVVRPDMLRSANMKIKRTSTRVLKKECLDLPPLIRQRVDVELSPEQDKHYKNMKREFITYVNDKACIARMALTKALRLQQIISGFMTLEDLDHKLTITRFKKIPRLDALEEILVDLHRFHKIIVWAVFRENYAMIREVCEKNKIKYVEVHGDISDKKKIQNVYDFSNDKDVRVFIGHPGAGGIGINLVESDISIFYSRGFDLTFDLQAEARNHRGGSEIHKKVTRMDIVAPGTLDEKILEALANKQKISDKVLRSFAEEI